MPPVLERLKRRSDFLRVAGAGRKWVTPGLILQARRQSAEDEGAFTGSPIRIGFTVSRKVGNAVQRNRARRRLRSAATEVMPNRAAGGVDYVLIGRGGTLNRPFGALLGDLETALVKLKSTRGGD